MKNQFSLDPSPIIANVSLADEDAYSKLVDRVADVYVGI